MTAERVSVEGVVTRHDSECSDILWWSVDSKEHGEVSDSVLEDFEGQRVRWTIELLDDEERASLETQLVDRLREWFRSAIPTVRKFGVAELTLRLKNEQGDDDGTLYLDCDVEEKNYTDLSGRVPGEKFG
jgi:hypothetical protein